MQIAFVSGTGQQNGLYSIWVYTKAFEVNIDRVFQLARDVIVAVTLEASRRQGSTRFLLLPDPFGRPRLR